MLQEIGLNLKLFVIYIRWLCSGFFKSFFRCIRFIFRWFFYIVVSKLSEFGIYGSFFAGSIVPSAQMGNWHSGHFTFHAENHNKNQSNVEFPLCSYIYSSISLKNWKYIKLWWQDRLDAFDKSPFRRECILLFCQRIKSQLCSKITPNYMKFYSRIFRWLAG